jgi:hypothetical protein
MLLHALTLLTLLIAAGFSVFGESPIFYENFERLSMQTLNKKTAITNLGNSGFSQFAAWFTSSR